MVHPIGGVVEIVDGSGRYINTEKHHRQTRAVHLRQVFAEDPGRGERLRAEAPGGVYFDYSKNRITAETKALLPKEKCIEFFKRCLTAGLIMMSYTPRVRVHPPLILSADQANAALAIIDSALVRME